MKKSHWILLALVLSITACEGCKPHDIAQSLHKLGVDLQCKKVATVATINGWPAINIEGRKENDYLPNTAIFGAIFVPQSLGEAGKKKAINAIGTAMSSKEAIEPNTIQDLEEGIVINYEGPKSKVMSEDQEDFSFIVSFIDPARKGLKPNTKYHVDVTAAAQGNRGPLVFSSHEPYAYTTSDFSENNPRQIKMSSADLTRSLDEDGKEHITVSFEAAAKALPATGAKFFLLVQENTDELFNALEKLIKNGHKLADGTELQTLTNKAAGFVPIDPAQPTLILCPLGGTTEGDDTLQTIKEATIQQLGIPKGITYAVHGLVYEPEGKYTVSTSKAHTIKVPAAEATLTMKKAEIQDLVADVSDKSAVHDFRLSLEGSVTNQKHTFTPTPYFIFHKSDAANATKEALEGAVNAAFKALGDTHGFHSSGGFIVYKYAQTIAHDKDETVTQVINQKAFKDEFLKLGATYQVYLALREAGGTTLVDEAKYMTLPVPGVTMHLDSQKEAKRIKTAGPTHYIYTEATVSTLTVNMQDAQMGVMFIQKPDQVVQHIRQVAADWKTTLHQNQHNAEVTHKRDAFYAISGANGCKRTDSIIQNTGKFSITAQVDGKYQAEGGGPLLKETQYYPVFWLWKDNFTFYAMDQTQSFHTRKFPTKEVWVQYGKHNEVEYERDHSFTVIRRKDTAVALDKTKEADLKIIEAILKNYYDDEHERQSIIQKLK